MQKAGKNQEFPTWPVIWKAPWKFYSSQDRQNKSHHSNERDNWAQRGHNLSLLLKKKKGLHIYYESIVFYILALEHEVHGFGSHNP